MQSEKMKCSYCGCSIADMPFPIFDGGSIVCGKDLCKGIHAIKPVPVPFRHITLTPGLANMKLGVREERVCSL